RQRGRVRQRVLEAHHHRRAELRHLGARVDERRTERVGARARVGRRRLLRERRRHRQRGRAAEVHDVVTGQVEAAAGNLQEVGARDRDRVDEPGVRRAAAGGRQRGAVDVEDGEAGAGDRRRPVLGDRGDRGRRRHREQVPVRVAAGGGVGGGGGAGGGRGGGGGGGGWGRALRGGRCEGGVARRR